jgi:hypothetical protein
MGVKGPVVIIECLVAGDGGTVFLRFAEPDNSEHTVLLPQYHIKENFNLSAAPGSILLDNTIVEPRGEKEKALLDQLRHAVIAPKRTGRKRRDVHNRVVVLPPMTEEEYEAECSLVRDLLKRIIAYVESGTYLQVSEKYGK